MLFLFYDIVTALLHWKCCAMSKWINIKIIWPKYLSFSVYGKDPFRWKVGWRIKSNLELIITHWDFVTLKTILCVTANLEQMSNRRCRPLAEKANTTASSANNKWFMISLLSRQPVFSDCRHSESSSIYTANMSVQAAHVCECSLSLRIFAFSSADETMISKLIP